MDVRSSTPQPPPATSAAMEHSEEIQAEADEPPDQLSWSPTKLQFPHLKPTPSHQRRESLLTRQILSETEHTDEDDLPPPPRTMSTQSTWSNPSTASMAELTSDDGRSVASPAISPPLPPTHRNNHIGIPEKPLEPKVKIVGEDHVVPQAVNQTSSEKSVEANLGRKRCISFACRSKQETKVEVPTSEPRPAEPTSPPKRKCMLKFVCPTRSGSEAKTKETPRGPAKRPISPPPTRRPTPRHRGSDSTVTHMSPKASRKASNPSNHAPKAETGEPAPTEQPKRYSTDSSDEDGGDSMRFHEFASSDDEPEQWVQESTCHRKRLTIDDTLEKENVIRKTCEEVEEEVLEEEEEDEDEELIEELAAVAEMDDGDDDLEQDDDYESDEGFHSDDEDGFANSDSEEDDDSDYEWWKPGPSTAATSVEQVDRLAIVNSNQIAPSSSLGSNSSGVQRSRISTKSSLLKSRNRNNQTEAMPIQRAASPGLPDSTDFVCGTLDEDRPLEQAYIHKKKLKDAAKHKPRPQDIDPTFPTSDPEMDEEDDDDVDEVVHSEADDLVHGELEELHGTIKKPSPMRARGRGYSNTHRSPPPPTTRIHSPGPAKRTGARSPPPPTMSARSPAPGKLFGRSPKRSKSPAPVKRMTSPPNSPTFATAQLSFLPQGLASRPQLTHTASLPRGGPITLSKLATIDSDKEDSDTGAATEIPKRGAIDIVKGVQWKRQRRKEKLYQKMCAKAAAKGEKQHKVKPGKGAERMRELGLQLQQYKGKAEHILSL